MTLARVMTPRGLWREVQIQERRDVTICIAAICDVRPDLIHKIVLCTDGRARNILGDTEHNLKNFPIDLRWRCLTSGDEPEILAVLPILKKRFAKTVIDETNVVEIVRRALQQRLLEKKEEFIQGRHAFSYERFLKEGKNILSDDQYRANSLQVEHISLRAQFIIAGFTSDGSAMLLETDDRGSVKIRENYAVIGDGYLLAQSSLVHRAHIEPFGLNRTLYSVYEAKKLAQRINTVGTEETIMVFHQDLTQEIINLNGRQFLWSLWLDHGPKDLPVTVKRRQKSPMFDTIMTSQQAQAGAALRDALKEQSS